MCFRAIKPPYGDTEEELIPFPLCLDLCNHQQDEKEKINDHFKMCKMQVRDWPGSSHYITPIGTRNFLT
jgi:hypothetical protein